MRLAGVVFGLETSDRLFVLLFLVRMAGQQRGAHSGENLVVKGEPVKKCSELRGDHFLPDVGLWAFSFEACAMIVDIPLLLDLADQSAATVATRD